MPFLLELMVSILLLTGAVFAFIGAIGLVRLPDFYMRLHAPTKASTLGVGAVALGTWLFFSYQNNTLSLHEVLITLFLFITAPISAHLLAKSALHLELEIISRTRNQPDKISTTDSNPP